MNGPRKIAPSAIYTGDRLQADMQRSTRTNTTAINNVPFMRGRLIKNVALTAAPSLVKHALGKEIEGYIVVRRRTGYGVVHDAGATNPDPTVYHSMSSSANTTVDLWMY